MRNKSLDFSLISHDLAEIAPNHWKSKKTVREVSYPESHHTALDEEHSSSFWYKHRERILSLVLRRYQPDWVLDVGGSNGELTKGLNEVTKMVLLEPHATAIINAKAKGLQPVIESDFIDANFKKETLPAVGLFDVMEHIEDDDAFLQSVMSCLQFGGQLFVTVPAYKVLWSSFDERVGHYRRYNRKLLYQKLEKAGFKVEYFTYLFWPLPPLIWLRRVLFSRMDNKKTSQNHFKGDSFMGKILALFLKLELSLVKRSKSLRFGSSCLCVATKS